MNDNRSRESNAGIVKSKHDETQMKNIFDAL